MAQRGHIIAVVLLIPFPDLRFGVLSMLNSSALRRAAHFPPFHGSEKPAHRLYQLSNVVLLLGPFFASAHIASVPLFWNGAALYTFGLLFLLLSVIGFAAPSKSGVHHKDVYRIPRNPIYVSYFFIFLGCVLLTQSLPLLAVLLVFQLTAHTIIRAEERWCCRTFGAAYECCYSSVRHYP